jgi:diguanylate cyclase (GGDEF)-like protein/PAS domain S-box-containing protein
MNPPSPEDTRPGVADSKAGSAATAHVEALTDRIARLESELRVTTAAFETAEGMMVTDAGGVILRVNRGFTRMTGYSANEAVGQRPAMLSSGKHDAAFYRQMWDAIHRDDRWEGEIWNRRKDGEQYPQHLSIAAVRDRGGCLSNYVAVLTDITQRKAASEEIEMLAFYDPLTRLPNRRLLLERLRQVLNTSRLHDRFGALMFIDLDNFKTLNDTLGHNVGDMLLQQVAGRLQSSLRHGDTVARLGGDEFVVLLEGLSSDEHEAAAHTEMLGVAIRNALNLPYILGTHTCHSTPSIGVTLFHNGHPPHPDELLMQADIAMYQAKQGGRNGMRFFDQGMQDNINARADLERALRIAIDLHQFELYYQIQVDEAGRPRGAEALVRWRADGKMMSPAQFVPLAEETGLILQLGSWVLEEACARLRAWQEDPGLRGLTLAVNVSAAQFHQPDFCEQVRGAVMRHAIDPRLLKLELTEGIVLKNVEVTAHSMKALRGMGVRISLDDFGTGYSSLQYLKRLPLSQLKIDQSFVRDLVNDGSDQAIVTTIIAMARSLGLDVIAEGVETDAQRALLHKLGCLHYQGYLFGRPMPVADFETLALGVTAAG